jgi:hypothetical protein
MCATDLGIDLASKTRWNDKFEVLVRRLFAVVDREKLLSGCESDLLT